MADETWESRAIPIMDLIAANEDPHALTSLDEFSDATGLSHVEVEVELERLINAEFIEGKIHRTMSGRNRGHWRLPGAMLLERGSRAVGQWPSDDPFDALLELIDQRILDGSLDDDTKSRLKQLRSTLVDVGKGAAGGVLAALIRTGLGL
jgi:hypothetical protein